MIKKDGKLFVSGFDGTEEDIVYTAGQPINSKSGKARKGTLPSCSLHCLIMLTSCFVIF